MSTFYRCEHFYLKEIVLSTKGEFPVCDCEKNHDINTDCNSSCTDFQQAKSVYHKSGNTSGACAA